MKKFYILFILVCILGICYDNRENIVNFFLQNYDSDSKLVFGEPNEYYKDFSYSFVQNTDSLYPNSSQDILNIIYSTLNRGLDEVTFYCSDTYDSCLDDVKDITENDLYLSTINNLVHPFNSYDRIHFSITNYGKVIINVYRNYSDSEIFLINSRIDQITSSLINDNMSDYDKILAFHDYVVNNTSYDDSVTLYNQKESITNSNNAIGLLFNNKAICSGYSDVMAIFLSRYGFNNYKISSDEHIWNLIYFDNQWLHLDATWDDPITSDGENVLLHDFFLVSTNSLFEKEMSFEKDSHQFDINLYMEAK